MRRWFLFGLATAGLSLGLTACTQANLPAVGAEAHVHARPNAPVGAVVHLVYDQFAPKVVTIHAGQSVEWKWNPLYNPYPADIIGPNFKSPIQNHGTYYHTFNTPGVYTYRSSLHADQIGKVIVVGS